MTSLRERYKRQTRLQIISAGVDLMREGGEEAVTIPRVAARAGVTERTIYRHFQNRAGLLQPVAEMIDECIAQRIPANTEELLDIPLYLFPLYDRDRQYLNASIYSRDALQARLRSKEQLQEAMVRCVREALPGLLNEDTLRRRAAIAHLLTTPYAWEIMGQFWDLDGLGSGDAAFEALEILLGRRRADADLPGFKDE